MLRIILGFCLMSNAWGERVRHVEVNGDQIVTVRTSIGIATIIQVPDRPNSVVVGDQDSFKVEYLDQAITIKPLTSSSRSNLYVYTDWRRFNIELITGPQSSADYVVYLKPPKTIKQSPIAWMSYRNSLRNGNIQFAVKRIGIFSNTLLMIEFVLTSTKKATFDPGSVWLTQNGDNKPIHNLILNTLEISPGHKVSGLLQIKKSDLLANDSFRIEIRRDKTSFLSIPGVHTWKF